MNLISIPIPKAGRNFEIDLDTISDENFPADVYKEIILQGLKTLLNRGQSKLASTKAMEGAKKEEAQKAIMEVVEAQWEACKAGKVRMSKGVRQKTSGAVMVEAMRIARLVIKDAIKRAGEKVSHYTAKAISEAAKNWLETSDSGKEVMAQAKANLEERTKTEEKAGIDLSGIKPDPKLVKKADEAKAKSKKKAEVPAGVTQRTKGQEHHAQH